MSDTHTGISAPNPVLDDAVGSADVTAAGEPVTIGPAGNRYTLVMGKIANFRDHRGFDTSWTFPAATPGTGVLVSMSQVSNGTPIQGAASCVVHNVVPGGGRVEVRGEIGWDTDLDMRQKFFLVRPEQLGVQPVAFGPGSQWILQLGRRLDFFQHRGFDVVVEIPGLKPNSGVWASICEIDNNGNPFQGAASCVVHNIVPEPNKARIRGEIGWDTDVRVRLNVMAVTPFSTPILDPVILGPPGPNPPRNQYEFLLGRFHTFDQHRGFETVVDIPGVTPHTGVWVSICELFDGKPGLGAASCVIHNVVPEKDRVRVRGEIGWERNLRVRLAFLIIKPL